MKTKAKVVEMSRAEKATSKAKKVIKANTPVAVKMEKENKPASVKRLTLCADARRKVAAGCTKEELKTYLVKQWGDAFPPAKHWYVNWHFSEAKRKGFLPKEFMGEMRAEKVPA